MLWVELAALAAVPLAVPVDELAALADAVVGAVSADVPRALLAAGIMFITPPIYF
jgi:hypothetical protein